MNNNYIKFSCIKCHCEYTVLKSSYTFVCMECYRSEVIDLDRMTKILSGFKFLE
jgi:protein-arginine kinase activator protein McsA